MALRTLIVSDVGIELKPNTTSPKYDSAFPEGDRPSAGNYTDVSPVTMPSTVQDQAILDSTCYRSIVAHIAGDSVSFGTTGGFGVNTDGTFYADRLGTFQLEFSGFIKGSRKITIQEPTRDPTDVEDPKAFFEFDKLTIANSYYQIRRTLDIPGEEDELGEVIFNAGQGGTRGFEYRTPANAFNSAYATVGPAYDKAPTFTLDTPKSVVSVLCYIPEHSIFANTGNDKYQIGPGLDIIVEQGVDEHIAGLHESNVRRAGWNVLTYALDLVAALDTSLPMKFLGMQSPAKIGSAERNADGSIGTFDVFLHSLYLSDPTPTPSIMIDYQGVSLDHINLAKPLHTGRQLPANLFAYTSEIGTTGHPTAAQLRSWPDSTVHAAGTTRVVPGAKFLYHKSEEHYRSSATLAKEWLERNNFPGTQFNATTPPVGIVSADPDYNEGVRTIDSEIGILASRTSFPGASISNPKSENNSSMSQSLVNTSTTWLQKNPKLFSVYFSQYTGEDIQLFKDDIDGYIALGGDVIFVIDELAVSPTYTDPIATATSDVVQLALALDYVKTKVDSGDLRTTTYKELYEKNTMTSLEFEVVADDIVFGTSTGYLDDGATGGGSTLPSDVTFLGSGIKLVITSDQTHLGIELGLDGADLALTDIDSLEIDGVDYYQKDDGSAWSLQTAPVGGNNMVRVSPDVVDANQMTPGETYTVRINMPEGGIYIPKTPHFMSAPLFK